MELIYPSIIQRACEPLISPSVSAFVSQPDIELVSQ